MKKFFILLLILFLGCAHNIDKTPKFKRGWIVNHTDHFLMVALYYAKENKPVWAEEKKLIAPYWFVAQQGCKTFRCSETNPSIPYADDTINLVIKHGVYMLYIFDLDDRTNVSMYEIKIDKNTPKNFTIDLE